jgi:hypothetical protein
MDDAAKNTEIAINPGTSTSGGRSRPIANDMKRKSGKRMPNMMLPGRR